MSQHVHLASITFSSTSVVSGTSLTGTVTLTNPNTSDVTVSLALNNSSDPCSIPASVVVPAGAISANFPIQTHAVTKTFTETIWGNYGTTQKASFHMTPASATTVPAITSAKTASGTVGSTFSYHITATNTPTSYSATGLPSGLTVNASTGVISGTPSAAGTSAVVLNASNASGTGSAALALTVASAAAPIITSATTASATVGSAFSYQITATNSPASFGATGLPAGLTLGAAGLISGTPSAAGISTVALTATNIGGTASATLHLTVNSAVGIPVITSATSASGTAGTAFSFEITATNTPTSYGAAGLPSGLSVNTASGLISGTPSAAGNSSVTLSAINSGGTGTAPLSLSIAAAPVLAPVITSAQSAAATVGIAFSYQIVATNTPTSYGATGLPSGLTINATGLISGTVTTAGTDAITLTASNSGGIGAAMLSLTVSAAAGGSLAAGLGTPTWQDLFNYTSSSEASFNANWNVYDLTAKNYASAGSNVTFTPANITFPINTLTGVPCMSQLLTQSSASASAGVETDSIQTFGYTPCTSARRRGRSTSPRTKATTGGGSSRSGKVT